MFLASVIISGQNWLTPGLLFLVLASVLLFWSYGRAPASGGRRAVCFLLKLLGVLALAACLLEPLWSRERARPGANYFAIVADNSQGMKIKDRGAQRSRGETLQGALAEERGWMSLLEENFQLRRYLFDSRLQSTRDFSELLFDGRVSALASSVRTLADRYKGLPLAGILLFTDGNATDLGEGLPDLTGLPPIYPVVMGTDDAVKDLALQRVTVSQTVFEDAPVTIQAEVAATGFAGETVVARLVKISGPTNAMARAPGSSTNVIAKASTPVVATTVAEQRQRIRQDVDTVTFRFQLKPEQSGLSFYRVQVTSKEDATPAPPAAESARTAEATLANNHRVIVVDRGRGPYRILYVSGRPNWEYKFLNRAVMEDDQIQLVGLIRIARREPKFEFRGRAGESSNPLFRGFGNQSKEEIERYDQPVLVRLFPPNTSDTDELQGGFPKLPEDLYRYHAVILDDLESEFFTPDQMTLLQKFVSERGGGFLMLGGAESFQQGKYQRTPIGDMLPVYLDQPADSTPPGELRLNFTREGWLQPWARLRNNEVDERRRLDEVPPFGVLNQVRTWKPGATPVATVADGRNAAQPAVVVQRFGHGRTGAVLLGDLWHWGLKDEANRKDLDKGWRQLMRWLVSDVPQRTEMQVQQQPGDPNQAVRLQVRVRDKKFQPLDNATVSIAVTAVGQESSPAHAGTNQPRVVRLTAEPALNETGVYEATYVPRETGGYRTDAVVTDATGMEVGRAEAGWTSDPAADEFRSLKPNRALLEAIAKKTGGEVLVVRSLDAFAKGLPNRKAPVTENWTSPLWHQAGVFLFALACFVAEWGLRRARGLA